MTPLQAIRIKCLDCCCQVKSQVKHCPLDNCPLYPFRLGKNPNRSGIGNSGNFTKKASKK